MGRAYSGYAALIFVVVVVFVLFLGSTSGLYADWLARRSQYVISYLAKNEMASEGLCLPNLALWTVC